MLWGFIGTWLTDFKWLTHRLLSAAQLANDDYYGYCWCRRWKVWWLCAHRAFKPCAMMFQCRKNKTRSQFSLSYFPKLWPVNVNVFQPGFTWTNYISSFPVILEKKTGSHLEICSKTFAFVRAITLFVCSIITGCTAVTTQLQHTHVHHGTDIRDKGILISNLITHHDEPCAFCSQNVCWEHTNHFLLTRSLITTTRTMLLLGNWKQTRQEGG